MSRDAFEDLLFAYHDGELSPGEAARVESHLAACRECRLLLEGWRRGAAALFPPVDPGEDETFVQRVMARVGREPSVSWKALLEKVLGIFSSHRWVAAGGTIAGAAALAAFFLMYSPGGSRGQLDAAEEAAFISDLVEGTSVPTGDESFGTSIETFLL